MVSKGMAAGMGSNTPRPPGTVAAASFGDLVCGLASPSPPMPYVGELGAATDAAAHSVVGDLLRAAGAPTRLVPEVKINGRTVGTTVEVVRAIPASPTPGMARIWTGSAIARIAGNAVTLQGAAAHVMPQSALADLGGGQTVLRLSEATQPVEPPEGEDGPSLEDARQSVPPRVAFDVASELHRIVSQCSPARRLDLAPAIYQIVVGDPVDVVTGSVVTRTTDYAQPWPAVRMRRRYESRRSGRCSPLGHGWSHELDQALWLEPGRVVVRDGDGREHEFSTMELPGRKCQPGDVLHDPARRLRLRCVGAEQWELSDGRTLRQFAARDVPAPQGLARLTRLVERDGTIVECIWAAPSGASASAAPPEGAPGSASPAAARLVEVRVDGATAMRLEHDGTGLVRRLLSVTSEGELVEATFLYSPERDLVQVTDSEGRARRYEYQGHLLVEEQDRSGARFHYGYDGVGPRARCVRAWGEGGFLDRAIEHDPGASRTIVRDGMGHETTYRYDAAGLVSSVVAPDGQQVSYHYDGHLRLVEVAWSDGTRATAAYDVMGNLVRRTERDGATWTMEHDARGRLVHGTDPQGGSWRFLYDERGRVRQLQDPAGHVTQMLFDRGSCRVLDATGHVVHLALDAFDRLVDMPAPTGERIRFAYDARGRLVTATHGKKQIQWRYDRAGRLVRYAGLESRVAWQRSSEGQVLAVEHRGGTTRVERDAFGLIRTIDDGQRALSYEHDNEGRLVSVKDGDTEIMALEHGTDGHVRAFTAQGMPRGEIERRARGRVTALRLGDDRIELEHDAVGRITKIDRGSHGTSTFAYRPDGMLMSATNEHVTCTFERDPRGAVTEQRWGDVSMGDAAPDHRGRRGGLRVGNRGRLSYLRRPDGAVERIAVAADGQSAAAWREPQQLRPTPSPDVPTVPVPTFEVASTDALGRPMSSRGPDHVVWDEDRCVAVGDLLVVHHPDHGQPLYALDGNGQARPLAARAPREASPLDRVLAAAFPAIPGTDAAEFAPQRLLADLLGHRAWNPHIRPVEGTGSWDPDAWEARVDAPEPDIGRLDAEALLRALGSPFPRPELGVRSFDRRPPPPEPLP